jgi:threonine/homoserine/homoserine lactone efflux protein
VIATLWQLLPITLSVIASPVAVLALLGIMLSQDPRRNAVAYSAGWIAATAVLLVIWMAVLTSVGVDGPGSPRPVARVLHLVVALCCWGGAAVTYRRARGALLRLAAARTPEELIAAAPQLPGLLRSTEHYTARRSFLLGIGVFALNPTNFSLVVATAISIVTSEFSSHGMVWLSVVFVIAASIPVVVPTALLLAKGAVARDALERLRTWVLRNNGFLSAGLLVLVGFLQLERAFEGVLA